jgi:eukaryotic-like serine/threonine-protein kinase
VTTRPVLHDCWSVNVSASGIGLTAGSGKEGGPTPGARLELAFKLPDGDVVTARGRITWATPVPTGRQPNVAFGVEFEPLVAAAAEALDRYLRRNRLRVGVAFAEDREAALLSSTFADRGNLLFASTSEQAQRLASQGNLAALLICGQEAQAAALVERLGGLEQLHAQGNAGATLPARPRLIFCAPVNGHRLVKFFNSGWIYRWLPPPLVPASVEETVSAACADYAWHAEREHMALALASARRDLADAAAAAAESAPTAGRVPAPPAAAFAPTAARELPPAVATRGWTSEERTLEPSLVRPLPLRNVGESERYEDPKPIAEGGMGSVVAYTDNRLARRVALKRVQAQFADDPEMAAALEREARVTGKLEHPNIIPVYDAGRDERGRPFYVMKLVKAPTLADVLQRLQSRQEPTASHPPGQLLRAFVQVCQAVDYAHSRGVIHCDLKPGNVLIGRYGQVLVVDWGLAYVAADGTVCRGGTPGYASPEQTDATATIDARTDVYGLGSILYELLCHRPPFDDHAYWSPEGFRHPRQLPVSPRQVASRSVPEELAEICLRALAVAPGDRYVSAGALATAIEAFLEGTKERQRRLQRCDALVQTADDLAANYFELLAARPERVAAVESLRASVAPWEAPERKRELWDAEDSLAVTDTLTVRTLQAAASTYEQALDEVRDDDTARRGLVRLYVSELRRAEQRRDERDRVYFEGLVNRHDDGTFARAAASSGSLTVECGDGGEVVVELARVEEQGRRLVAAPGRTLGRPPLREIPLALGSYLVTVTAPGVPPVRFPILVKGGGRVRLFAELAALCDCPAGEVLVPGGPAMLGGDEGAAGGRQMSEAQVASFYVQERPVSFGEYLQFLTDVMKTLGQTAAPLIPRHGHNAPFWRWTGQEFELAEMAQWGDDRAELLEIPVFGIDLRGAEGYAQWKSRQTGRRYRLPTEEEWEKAGRGTDGRLYPWGNHFDASFCCMRESSPGTPRPRPRGLFAADVSPFGVWDMAGGVAEWATPPVVALRKGVREIVTRGGAWCDWRSDCLLAGHRPYVVGERSARVGFRLVREAPASVGYEIA